MALLTHLLFHTSDVIRPDLCSKILLPVIKMIHYNRLSRQNKQILSGLLEMCKQKPRQDGFEAIVAQLESTIFERSNKERPTPKEKGKE